VLNLVRLKRFCSLGGAVVAAAALVAAATHVGGAHASARDPYLGRGLLIADGGLYLFHGESEYIGDLYPSPCSKDSPPHESPCQFGWPTWDKAGRNYAYTVTGYGDSNPATDSRVVVVSNDNAEGSWPYEAQEGTLDPEALTFSPDGLWLAMSLLVADAPYNVGGCYTGAFPDSACHREIFLLGWGTNEHRLGPIFRGDTNQEFVALDWRKNTISYVARQRPGSGETRNVIGHFATNNRSGSQTLIRTPGTIETARFSPDGKIVLLDATFGDPIFPGLPRSLYEISARPAGPVQTPALTLEGVWPGDFAGSFGLVAQPTPGLFQFWKDGGSRSVTGPGLEGKEITAIDWFVPTDVADCGCPKEPLQNPNAVYRPKSDPFNQPG
jgi:WD40-like Beta Propeller Repeat